MDVTAWLLDGDPAIRWQTRLDLLDDAEGTAADRALVESEGWGARLLDLQHEDGTWGHGVWTQRDWVGVDDALLLLALLGAQGPRTAAAVDRVVAHVDWGPEWWHHPFFDGEVEPCINGRVLVAGSRHFTDYRSLRSTLNKLLVNRLPDVELLTTGGAGVSMLAASYATKTGIHVGLEGGRG